MNTFLCSLTCSANCILHIFAHIGQTVVPLFTDGNNVSKYFYSVDFSQNVVAVFIANII